jgi:hypothetical protein
MRTLVASLLVLGLLGSAVLAQEPITVDPEIVRALRSSDRAERYDAITKVSRLDKVPESLLEPIASFIRLEVSDAIAPDGPAQVGNQGPITEVPLVGDEVSLVRLKANPDDYIGKTFVLCGGIRVSTLNQNSGKFTSSDYYSFTFRSVDSKVRMGEDLALIYMSRSIGRPLSDLAIGAEEKGFQGALVRLKCTVDPKSLLQPDAKEFILVVIEALDWQRLGSDRKRWTPWAFEGVPLGFALLKAGRAIRRADSRRDALQRANLSDRNS